MCSAINNVTDSHSVTPCPPVRHRSYEAPVRTDLVVDLSSGGRLDADQTGSLVWRHSHFTQRCVTSRVPAVTVSTPARIELRPFHR